MSYARELGYTIHQAVAGDAHKENEIRSALGLGEHEAQRLYSGRLFLTSSDIRKIASILNIPAMTLVNLDTSEYDKNVVHCMTPFKDRNNREMILNLINSYIDIKEALED